MRDLMRGKEKPGEAVGGTGSTGELPPPPPYPSGDVSLPPGWEARFDEGSKKTFYIDHNTKVGSLTSDQRVHLLHRMQAVWPLCKQASWQVGTWLPHRCWHSA